MKAVIYISDFTHKKAANLISLAAQYGFSVFAAYIDTNPGKSHTAFQRMIEDYHSGLFSCVFIHESDSFLLQESQIPLPHIIYDCKEINNPEVTA